MNTLRTLYHLARTDFLERVRRYSFLVLLGATVYLGYLFVPPVDAAYQTVALGDARGFYNSAWVGAMFGLMISTGVTLIAFYPIKDTVGRDRQTQVGQIIAATPMRKAVYALGKWLSNVALLALLLLVMTGMAVVMQLIRAEDRHVDLLAMAVPLWLIAFPALTLVAATAVFFECTPVLRGGVGNVAYFFLFMAVLIVGISGADGEIMKEVNEPFGIAAVIPDMQRAVKVHNPRYDGQVTIGGEALSADPLLFHWEGMAWTSEMIWKRLSWIGVAGLIALAAALPFDRFDPARSRLRHRPRAKGDAVDPAPPLPVGDAPSTAEASVAAPAVRLTPLPARRFRPRLGQVLLAELRLAFKGCRWWWAVVVVALNVAGLAVPDPAVRQYLYVAAWFWPILLWSSMGARARRHNTVQIVSSTPRPEGRQLFAAWLAGVCVAALTSAGFAIRRAFSGQWAALAAWAAGALFIPSLALALGVWSGSSRAFEVIYALLWYVGPLNGVPVLDYMGVTPEAAAGQVWPGYLLAAGVLAGLAVLGRRWVRPH